MVGPGFKEAMMPGWPRNPNSPMLETDFEYGLFILPRATAFLESGLGAEDQR